MKGLYFNTKAQNIEQFNLTTVPDAQAKLVNLIQVYFQGQQQPLLLNGELAEKVFSKTRGKAVEITQSRFESIWQGDMSTRGLGEDEYLNYFWPECPQYDQHKQALVSIYEDIYERVVKQKAPSIFKMLGFCFCSVMV